jgi:hypothetical protein
MNTLESIEIWDKCFAKIADTYLGEPAPYKQMRFLLQGYDSNHNPIPMLTAKGDGQPATKGCFWDCESSDFAYRIQQYDSPNGGWNYRIDRAYETEDEELNVRIPYFRWFSPYLFNTHTHDDNQVMAQWHNYLGWSIFKNAIGYYGTGINSTTLPHYQVVQQDLSTGPNYWDNLGHEITSSTVKGIQKGFGQWFVITWSSSSTVVGHGTDFCESTPDLAFMRQFMSQQLNINPAFTCPPNLGGGPSGGGNSGGPIKFPGGFDLIKYSRWEFVKKPLGSYGGGGEGSSDSGHQGTPLDQEIVFFNGDNRMERISDLFAPEVSGSVEERFAHILSESELFALERFDSVRTVMIYGNFDSFFSPNGTPTFPDLNLAEGLYRLSVKLKDRKVFFLVFEVRHPFDVSVELKSYFEALLFPDPHSDNIVKANISTTAALRVNYTLFDHMGSTLYIQDFNLPKDHSGEHALNFDGHLPEGFIYHKFTFEDGSHKSYTTIKQ